MIQQNMARYLFFIILYLLSLCAAAQTIRPMPVVVPDQETLWLDCGEVYSGELKLVQARNVTVRTAGSCGKATLTPAIPVKGWARDPRRPQVWFAATSFRPSQLQLGEEFIALAHHPNTSVPWLKGKRQSPQQLRVTLPNDDLSHASIVWRAADWLIQSRAVAGYQAGLLTLAPGDDEGFGLLPETEFYLEGMRWMLDSPGEWAWHEGLLFVWPHDGKSPEGRAWASQRSRAIDARGSQGVAIVGVRIFGASVGVDGSGSRNLVVRDTEIINSSEEALLLGSGARVQSLWVKGSQQHGLRADDDAIAISVSDSRFDGVGMLGMPRRSKGVIVFETARDVLVERNQISDAAYIGIRVFRDARVSDNVIARACLRLSDCGGIYTFARDRQRLNTIIERNRVSGLAGRSAYGIYLDDFANGVSVSANHLENNGGGIELHNGFDNQIVANRFVNNRHEHVLFNETAPFASISGNQVSQNQFVSTGEVPVYRLWSRHGSTYVKRFADFSSNDYQNPPKRFAEVEGMGMLDIAAWRSRIADEQDATRSALSRSPKLSRQRQQK